MKVRINGEVKEFTETPVKYMPRRYGMVVLEWQCASMVALSEDGKNVGIAKIGDYKDYAISRTYGVEWIPREWVYKDIPGIYNPDLYGDTYRV